MLSPCCQATCAAAPRHVIVRLSNAYGPGYDNNRTIPRLVRNRLLGKTLTIRDELRDYVYVSDLNEASLASPAVSNGTMVFRTVKKLVAVAHYAPSS